MKAWAAGESVMNCPGAGQLEGSKTEGSVKATETYLVGFVERDYTAGATAIFEEEG